MHDARESADALAEWLVKSGVQVADIARRSCGGLHAGYETDSHQWTFVYPEITGYAISVYCVLYRVSGREQYRMAATNAAAFLLRYQATSDFGGAAGAFPQAIVEPDDAPSRAYYSFDTAMCIQGLLALYGVTGDEALKAAAQRAGNWLLTMQLEDGCFRARYDLETDSADFPGPYFHQDAGCQHAKHAIALLRLAAVTGDSQYELAARRVCDWVLSLQDEDGAFWANTSRSHVYSHAHCYATEGLLFACSQLGTAAYGDAVARACGWLERMTVSQRGVLGTYKRAPGFLPTEAETTRRVARVIRRWWPRKEIATDATAQAARLFLYRAIGGEDPSGKSRAGQLLRELLAGVAYRGQEEVQRGSVFSRLDVTYRFPRPTPMIATWSVEFLVHACLHLVHGNGEIRIDELF